MVNGKMCVGILNDELMARIDPATYEKALERKACREMDFTEKPMKGFVFAGPEVLHWILIRKPSHQKENN
jgi:hypothetical protein